MLDLLTLPVRVRVMCEGENTDAKVRLEHGEAGLRVYLTATESLPTYIHLDWETALPPTLLVLGDAWERSYGELQFLPIADNDRAMPWYFLATDKTDCFCVGAQTQPNAFVSFRCDPAGIHALLDVRNGGCGVALGGRELAVATVLFASYPDTDDFTALCDFCRRMCPAPILPDAPVYGGNNWYYAYGDSSFAQIDADAALLAHLSQGIANPPFEVIDDGWQPNECAGPWVPNERFADMRKMADSIHAKGLRAGLWMRPLRTLDPAVPRHWLIQRDEPEYLDPTHPDAAALIASDVGRIRGWGFDLVKHDFSTFDLFGQWGGYGDRMLPDAPWHFYDRTKTNAEITLDLYRLIRRACGDMLIIGCNTVSHLCAGLVEINRTGNDTSGREWAPNVQNGVNTLAFRLAQNEAFYLVDADCVGIIPGQIPWEKNKQWLQLLSYSNTALFVSCTDAIDGTQRADLAAAFRSIQTRHAIEPVNRYDTPTPDVWRFDGETVKFSF